MWKKIKQFLLNILGDIKVYRYPFFMVYDPSTFLVKGYHTRHVMEVIRPGDVVLRKFRCYLDGFFIPGAYSHSGIYTGDGKVVHAIAEGVEEIDIIDFLRCDSCCVLRPDDEKQAALAVERAKAVIGTPYDFDFTDGTDALYCHELTATCYREFGVEKKEVRILGFRLKPRFTCDSFLENEHFGKVFETVPKSHIALSEGRRLFSQSIKKGVQ